MLKYKFDVLDRLKKKGYSTYRLQKENLLNQSAVQSLRDGKVVGAIVLDRLCTLLNMQPGSIIEWQPDPQPETEPEQ